MGLPLLIFVCLFLFQVNNADVLEPWVSWVPGVFSKEDCKLLIDEAEKLGFSEESDSIDYNDPRGAAAWATDTETDGEDDEPTLTSIYKKYLPALSQIVSEHKVKLLGDEKPPSLDWVFLRKYEAGATRRMLTLHNDVNLFTINVALNDDFEGGGLFYHKPDSDWGMDGLVPDIPEEMMSYEFVEQIKRVNTSSGITFPDLKTGDVLIHNYTLFHAIAPIEIGIRYSLLFFYDQEHPHVAHLLSHDVNVTLVNEFEEPVSLYWISSDASSHSRVLVLYNIPKNPKTVMFTATSDEIFEVRSKLTGKLLTEFDIPSESNTTGIIELFPDDDENDDDNGDDLEEFEAEKWWPGADSLIQHDFEFVIVDESEQDISTNEDDYDDDDYGDGYYDDDDGYDDDDDFAEYGDERTEPGQKDGKEDTQSKESVDDVADDEEAEEL